ncbi:MAG: hypothetical protein NXY57DRAFT_968063 [Lentinula lateritia]|nr:MAG: hypothetical protein NXY57DRAFT_968063 [Lentinula lateritia]
MASPSSQTQASASSTRLPCSLMEAQVMLAGISFKSTLPLFFESAVFQRLQQGDYSPPIIDSNNSPDYDGSGPFPAFSYPRSLVPFCFPFETLRTLSVASGLDLYCSAQMAVQTLQVLTDDSPSTESSGDYDVFEEAAPFLNPYLLGLPIFLHDNLTQQWGVPPEHRSSAEGVHKFERFPAIPIPFCLRFHEGSAIMHMVLSKDLDPFASLRGQSVLPGVPKTVSPPKVSDVISPSPASKAQAVPPRALRRNREVESLKADTSSFLASPRSTCSKDSDNKLLSGLPLVDAAPQASSSVKASPPILLLLVWLTKGFDFLLVRGKKARQVVVSDEDLTSKEVESEDEDEDEDEEVAPPPKRLKTTSSISVKRVTVPKRVTKAAGKLAPERSPSSTFQLVLLADAQGRLRLQEQSTGNFTPFPKFAHARNPLLAVNPDFIELGSILETQNARFMMQDLMQVNRPSIPSQACVSALARGDLEANSAPLPGYKCQACSSWSLKCLGSLDVELAMAALNALHKASTSSTHTMDLNDQMKQVGSLFDTRRELFLRSILDLQNAGEDPIVVLEALKTAEPNRWAITLNEWTLMATLFRWPSPFNLSGLDFDNWTPGEWIELLHSIHSGESTARVDKDGHLIESSPPPDSAAEVFEGLNEVEKGSADEGSSSQVGGSIPVELDLPMIESLAEPTLSPEKGAEEAQTLES